MKVQPLTTAELLMKEMAEMRANQLARQLIEDHKNIDVPANITVSMAKVLPLIKPEGQQRALYEMMVEAAAGFISTQAQLSNAVNRIKELTEQNKELTAQNEQLKDTVKEEVASVEQLMSEIDEFDEVPGVADAVK